MTTSSILNWAYLTYVAIRMIVYFRIKFGLISQQAMSPHFVSKFCTKHRFYSKHSWFSGNWDCICLSRSNLRLV